MLRLEMKMILITGASGQLGTELRHLLDERSVDYVATDASELDITNEAAVNEAFEQIKPTVVYHCAAYTAVDKAEDEGRELDYQVNVVGTENIAKACEKYDSTLVYISTDYVFNGEKELGQEWLEDEVADPQTEYGRTKYLGEEAVRKYVKNHYIIRTSWVFGNYGHNFVYTMLKLAESHDTLTVVDDQFGRPTWTRTLAEFMTYLVDNRKPYGTYHLSNDNTTNWYEFAKEILKDKDITITPVDSSQFPQKAKRPKNSTMSLEKTKATGFVIPSWQDALGEMMKNI